MKLVFALFVVGLSFFSGETLEGTWKLQSYSTIDAIKSTPAYQTADDAARDIIDAQFETLLKEGMYRFGPGDTLYYTDMQGGYITNRRALFSLSNDTLYINEIDRSFQREALVHLLTADSLVFSPIVYGEVGDGKMVFTRTQ